MPMLLFIVYFLFMVSFLYSYPIPIPILRLYISKKGRLYNHCIVQRGSDIPIEKSGMPAIALIALWGSKACLPKWCGAVKGVTLRVHYYFFYLRRTAPLPVACRSGAGLRPCPRSHA